MINLIKRIWNKLFNKKEKRVFYMAVGNPTPEEVAALIEKMKADLKKAPIVDPKTGQVNLKYNPKSLDEDFYL